nr:hypothetical protein [Tanacetum cinerariifolium]
MSDASSTVTYTSVYMDSEPWRYYGEDSAETGPLRVIVYGYDGLPIQPVAPPSSDYVPGPEHPPSPDYVPGPKHPPSHFEIPYVPESEYLEYLEPSDDEAPLEYQPLPADASPIVASPDYVADFDSEENPEDDQADYPADGGDAGDVEALEADEPTHAPGSPIIIPLSQTHLRRARKTVKPEPPMLASMEAWVAEIRMRALLSSTSRMTNIPEDDMPPRKRTCLSTPTPGFEVGESSATSATRQPGPIESDLRRCRVEQAGYRITDTWDEIVDTLMEMALTTLKGVNERVTELETTVRQRTTKSSAIAPHVRTLETHVATLIAQTLSLQTQLTTTLGRIEVLEAKDPEPQEGPAELIVAKMAPKKKTTRATPATTTTLTTTATNAQLQALIDRGAVAALAEHDADRSRNGDNSNNLGTDGRRQMTTPRECTYTDFLKCQPMSFQGTKGVVGSALTWWNSHMRVVGQDVAYAMPWVALKRMIISKYCQRGEIQKLESKYWNLKVKGLDLLNYNHHFQELALMCERMFPEEAAKEVIEIAIEMMDKKMLTHVKRQAEQKRKFDDP